MRRAIIVGAILFFIITAIAISFSDDQSCGDASSSESEESGTIEGTNIGYKLTYEGADVKKVLIWPNDNNNEKPNGKTVKIIDGKDEVTWTIQGVSFSLETYKKDSNGKATTDIDQDYRTLMTMISEKHPGLNFDSYSVEVQDFTQLPSACFYKSGVTKFESKSVRSFGDSCFRGCDKLESVTGREDEGVKVESVGTYSFYGCTQLKSFHTTDEIDLKGIKVLLGGAFWDCQSLTGIKNLDASKFSSGSPYLKDSTFRGCSKLDHIWSSNTGVSCQIELQGFKGIGDFCFSNSFVEGSLITLDISGVGSIGYRCFDSFVGSGVSRNVSVAVVNASSLNAIGGFAFRHTDPIAFSQSSQYSDGIFDLEEVTQFGSYIFSNCTNAFHVVNFKAADIPEGIFSSSGIVSFNDPDNKEAVDLTAIKTVGKQAFYNCLSLRYVKMPPGVETIGVLAFAWDSNITGFNSPGEIVLPSGLTGIGSDAFYACCPSVSTIHVPASVKKIEFRAFGISHDLEFFFHDIASFEIPLSHYKDPESDDPKIIVREDKRSYIVHTGMDVAEAQTRYGSYFYSDQVNFVEERSGTLHLSIVSSEGYRVYGSEDNNGTAWKDYRIIENGKIVLPFLRTTGGYESFGFGVGSNDPKSDKQNLVDKTVGWTLPKDTDLTAYAGPVLDTGSKSGEVLVMHIPEQDGGSKDPEIYLYNGIEDSRTGSVQFLLLVDHLIIPIRLDSSDKGYSIEEETIDWKYGDSITLSAFSGVNTNHERYKSDSGFVIYLRDKDGRSCMEDGHGVLLSRTIVAGYWETGFTACSDGKPCVITWLSWNSETLRVDGSLNSEGGIQAGSKLGEALESIGRDIPDVSVIQRPGYTSETQWRTDAGGGGSVVTSDTVITNTQTTFYLYYPELESYVIRLILQGNTVASVPVSGPYKIQLMQTEGDVPEGSGLAVGDFIYTYSGVGHSYRLSSLDAMAGYSFTTYKVEDTSKVTVYDPDDVNAYIDSNGRLSGGDIVSDIDIAIVAKQKVYAVTYYQSYGGKDTIVTTGNPSIVTYSDLVASSGLRIEAPEPSTGYSLSNITVNGKNSRVLDGNVTYLSPSSVPDYRTVSAITVVFVYEEGFKIAFDYGVDDYGQQMPVQMETGVFKEGSTYILTESTTVKTGYTFDHWEVNGKEIPLRSESYSVSEIQNLSGAVDDTTIVFTAVWKPVVYPVEFDASGGIISTESGAVSSLEQKFSTNNGNKTIGDGTIEADKGISKTGYRFIGWTVVIVRSTTGEDNAKTLNSTDKLVLDPVFLQGYSEADGDRIVATANWEAKEYTVQFSLGEDVVGDPPKNLKISLSPGDDGKDHAVTLPNTIARKNSSEFAGWTVFGDRSGRSDPYQAGETFVITVDNGIAAYADSHSDTVTVTAEWSDDIYTIVFDPNGGTYDGNLPQITGKLNSPISGWPDAGEVSRIGYSGSGWAYGADEKSEIVSLPDPPVITGRMANYAETVNGVKDVITLYVVWDPQEYGIAYDYSGGAAGETAPESAYSGVVITISEPKRTGYEFTGWTAEGLGTGARYRLGDSLVTWRNAGSDPLVATSFTDLTYVADGTVKLTAHWSEVRYTVSYDLEGGEGSTPSSMYPLTVSGDTSSLALPPATGLSKTGYTFGGWSVDGITSLGSGVTVQFSSAMAFAADDANTVTLRAVWIPNSYSIHVKETDQISYDVSAVYGESTDLGIPSRTSYDFAGWKLVPATDEVKSAEARYSTTGNLWITWPSDGAVNARYVMNLALSSTIHVEASWQPSSIYIVYNLNGGRGSTTGGDATVTAASATIKLPTAAEVTRDGYALRGWSVNGTSTISSSDVAEVVLAADSNNTVTLTAVWGTVDYLLQYRSLDTDRYTEVSAAFDVSINIGTPTRAGYNFTGWVSSNINSSTARYSQDGSYWVSWPSGSSAARGGYVMNLTGTANATVTLEASWEPIIVTLDYDLNGGEGGITGGTTQVHMGMTGFTFPTLSTAARDGYAFKGWSMDKETVLAGYTDRMVLEAGSDNRTTIYAVWSPNTYYIEYRSTEDASYIRTQVYYDASVEIGVPERTGYSFQGWFSTDADTANGRFSTNDVIWQQWPSDGTAYGGYVKNLSGTASGTAHLTATWEKISYTVRYSANGATGEAPVDSATYTLGDPFQLASVDSLRGTYGNRIPVGWSTDETASAAMTIDSFVEGMAEKADSSNNVTLYAVWIEGKYSVYVDIGKGEPTIVPSGWTKTDSGLYTREADYGTLTKDVMADWDDTVLNYDGHKFTAWRYDVSSVITDVTVTADYDEVQSWLLYAFIGIIAVIAVIAVVVTRLERW